MHLNDALLEIAHIRRQMARSGTFRGYRAATSAFTGALAVAASAVESWWLPRTVEAILALWVSVALVSVAVVGAELVLRARKNNSTLQNELTVSAVEQFVPCLVAGGLLTFVLAQNATAQLWLLPGLWAMFFGLGVFASRRLLPRGMGAVGGWYLLAGAASISIAAQTQNLAPWHMGVTFGVGQALAAAVLYWNLERTHD